MELTNHDLLPDEHILFSKRANAVVKRGIGGIMGEAIGGELYLTNYRLIFKSHIFNRLRGKFSIFLPTITEMRDSSSILAKKVTIVTKIIEFEFVIWKIHIFIKSVESAKTELKEDDILKIRQYAAQYYERCDEGLEIFGGLEVINKVFLEGQVPVPLKDSQSSEFKPKFSMPTISLSVKSYDILREFDIEEHVEILSVDEFPLDYRFGSNVLTLEQEFSKTTNNEIFIESIQEEQGKLSIDIFKLLQAELTLDLSKKVGYKHGESTTCRYTTKINVKMGEFIIYKITWKRKIRRSKYEIQVDDQHYVIPTVARYGVGYEITSSKDVNI